MRNDDPAMSLLRVLRASAIGALVGSIVLGLSVWLEGLGHGGFPEPLISLLPLAPLLLLASTFCAFLGTIFVGLPTMVVLRAAGAESLPAYLFAGALAGLLLTGMIEGREPSVLSYFLAYPMATAAAFWHGVRMPALREARDA